MQTLCDYGHRCDHAQEAVEALHILMSSGLKGDTAVEQKAAAGSGPTPHNPEDLFQAALAWGVCWRAVGELLDWIFQSDFIPG